MIDDARQVLEPMYAIIDNSDELVEMSGGTSRYWNKSKSLVLSTAKEHVKRNGGVLRVVEVVAKISAVPEVIE